MSDPPPTAAERFAIILRCLSGAVAAMSGGNRLAGALIDLIIGRIRDIHQRVARIVARLRAGTYAPRRASAPRRPSVLTRPRPPGKLPQRFGWLQQFLPEAVQYRGQLEYLLRDPEMVALLATAPASLARPLRSLCWMLRLDPPDILALPAKPRPAKPRPAKPRPAKPRPGKPQPAREQKAAPPKALPAPDPPLPEWLRDRRKPWSLARIRGSPGRA